MHTTVLGWASFFKNFLNSMKNIFYCFRSLTIVLASCPGKHTTLNEVPVTCLHFENTYLNGYIDEF